MSFISASASSFLIIFTVVCSLKWMHLYYLQNVNRVHSFLIKMSRLAISIVGLCCWCNEINMKFEWNYKWNHSFIMTLMDFNHIVVNISVYTESLYMRNWFSKSHYIIHYHLLRHCLATYFNWNHIRQFLLLWKMSPDKCKREKTWTSDQGEHISSLFFFRFLMWADCWVTWLKTSSENIQQLRYEDKNHLHELISLHGDVNEQGAFDLGKQTQCPLQYTLMQSHHSLSKWTVNEHHFHSSDGLFGRWAASRRWFSTELWIKWWTTFN